MSSKNIYKPRYFFVNRARSKITRYKNGYIRRFFERRSRRVKRGGLFRRYILVANNRKWTTARRFILPIRRRSSLKVKYAGSTINGKPVKRRYIRSFFQKQQLRYFYGNRKEHSFRSIFNAFQRKQGASSRAFFSKLESRLDRTLYRRRFFPTVYGCRQFMLYHGVLLNHNIEKSPRQLINVGDTLSLPKQVWRSIYWDLFCRTYYRRWGQYIASRRFYKHFKQKIRRLRWQSFRRPVRNREINPSKWQAKLWKNAKGAYTFNSRNRITTNYWAEKKKRKLNFLAHLGSFKGQKSLFVRPSKSFHKKNKFSFVPSTHFKRNRNFVLKNINQSSVRNTFKENSFGKFAGFQNSIYPSSLFFQYSKQKFSEKKENAFPVELDLFLQQLSTSDSYKKLEHEHRNKERERFVTFGNSILSRKRQNLSTFFAANKIRKALFPSYNSSSFPAIRNEVYNKATSSKAFVKQKEKKKVSRKIVSKRKLKVGRDIVRSAKKIKGLTPTIAKKIIQVQKARLFAWKKFQEKRKETTKFPIVKKSLNFFLEYPSFASIFSASKILRDICRVARYEKRIAHYYMLLKKKKDFSGKKEKKKNVKSHAFPHKFTNSVRFKNTFNPRRVIKKICSKRFFSFSKNKKKLYTFGPRSRTLFKPRIRKNRPKKGYYLKGEIKFLRKLNVLKKQSTRKSKRKNSKSFKIFRKSSFKKRFVSSFSKRNLNKNKGQKRRVFQKSRARVRYFRRKFARYVRRRSYKIRRRRSFPRLKPVHRYFPSSFQVDLRTLRRRKIATPTTKTIFAGFRISFAKMNSFYKSRGL